MVKQVVEIKKTKTTPVDDIIPGGVLGLQIIPKSGIISTESCGHVECQKYGHCRDCRCERCVRDFGVDKDEKTKKFIRKARKVHGDRYEYIKTIYTKNEVEVTITCKVHGDFIQEAHNHTKGSGCRDCAKNKPLTTESFITRSNRIHNGKYTYLKVTIKDVKTKITITCPEHGDFTQTPNSHLNGHGCLKCKHKNSRHSLEEFIQISTIAHKGKYSYSKTEYDGVKKIVTITCPIHGDFKQKANLHLRGHGCKKCQADKRRVGKEKFIERAIKKHGNKFGYSFVEYIDNNTNVILFCSVHGKFEQTPSNHLSGRGCLECSGHKRLTAEEFVIRASKKHNNKYTYLLVKYINMFTRITITCPIHGDFPQTPNGHLHGGYGCKLCMHHSKGEIKTNSILEELLFDFEHGFRPSGCENPKTRRQLEFDFYIKKYNLIIEYDGKQHFSPFAFGSKNVNAEEEFKLTQYLDSIKNKYCIDNRINLLRIHHGDFYRIKELILEAIAKIEASKTDYIANLYKY